MNLDLLQTVAGQLRAAGGPWCIGGDFNCTPTELEATGWLTLVDGCIVAPTAPTCNGKTYDFFVVSSSMKHSIKCVVAIEDLTFEPHSPARIILDGRPRAGMVRQLAKYVAAPAVIPFGPPTEPPKGLDRMVQHMDVGMRCRTVIGAVEAELAGLQGITPGEIARMRSRTEGPKFVWCKTWLVSRIQHVTPFYVPVCLIVRRYVLTPC